MPNLIFKHFFYIQQKNPDYNILIDNIFVWMYYFFQDIGNNITEFDINFDDQYMIEGQLFHQWGIWFTYHGEPNQYEDNLELTYELKTIYDLVYLWKNSPIVSLNNYFYSENLTQQSYFIKNKWRRVNSIEMFKKGISPKWEDPKNQNGARFIFTIPKSYTRKEELYEGFVFHFIGQDFKNSDFVNGLRFVTSKNLNISSYRVQIWVSFTNDNIQALTSYQQTFTALFKKFEFKIQQIHCMNLKDKDPSSFKKVPSESIKQ